MSEQFREHLSAAVNLAIERTLAEYENITYSEVIGVLDTVKMEMFFEYLETKKNDTTGDERETPETQDRSPYRKQDGERGIPPSKSDSDETSSAPG